MTHKTDIDLFNATATNDPYESDNNLFLMPPTVMTHKTDIDLFFNATDIFDPYESDTDLF